MTTLEVVLNRFFVAATAVFGNGFLVKYLNDDATLIMNRLMSVFERNDVVLNWELVDVELIYWRLVNRNWMTLLESNMLVYVVYVADLSNCKSNAILGRFEC